MSVLRLSRSGYPPICPTCHHLQAHLLARLFSSCDVGPLPLHITESSPRPCPWILNPSTQCVCFSRALQVVITRKKGHLFSVTWTDSHYFWLKHTDLPRDYFIYGLRWNIGGWMLTWVASGEQGALLCRRRIFVLSHIRGSDKARDLCREQGCPAGCHCNKVTGQKYGNTVSVPQPGRNKWISLTLVYKI